MIPEIENILDYAIEKNKDDSFFGEKQIFRSEKEQLVIKIYEDFITIDLVILPLFAKEGFRNILHYSIPEKQLKSITVKRMILQDVLVEHNGDIKEDVIAHFEDKLAQFFENYTIKYDKEQLEKEEKLTMKIILDESRKHGEIVSKLYKMINGNYKPFWES